MSRLPRPLTLAATGLTAIALSLPLAACSSTSDADSTSTASGQAVTAESSADAADTGSGTAAQTGSDSTASVPDGYTAVEIPDSSVSFAVPSDWVTLTSDDADDDALVSAYTEASGQEADSVQVLLQMYAVIAASNSGTSEEINAQITHEVTELRSEEEVTKDLEDNGLNFNDLSIETTTTGSGAEARTMSYSLDLGQPMYVMTITTVTPEADGVVSITITTGTSAERTQELADAILASL
ncbi:hypothetical protein [Actinomyces sp. MRS3W]|uniref:hypothetical protein n=1 Tax=Actinomyces sp. MRS3W TaxID=2800796 RepID=UPI0028FD6924|nr:hypothetical protein [Actinomyces sp. MRS3W]MDU0348785.1 hypothetical protein [Actinomyces sp. MRS3W]